MCIESQREFENLVKSHQAAQAAIAYLDARRYRRRAMSSVSRLHVFDPLCERCVMCGISKREFLLKTSGDNFEDSDVECGPGAEIVSKYGIRSVADINNCEHVKIFRRIHKDSEVKIAEYDASLEWL